MEESYDDSYSDEETAIEKISNEAEELAMKKNAYKLLSTLIKLSSKENVDEADRLLGSISTLMVMGVNDAKWYPGSIATDLTVKLRRPITENNLIQFKHNLLTVQHNMIDSWPEEDKKKFINDDLINPGKLQDFIESSQDNINNRIDELKIKRIDAQLQGDLADDHWNSDTMIMVIAAKLAKMKGSHVNKELLVLETINSRPKKQDQLARFMTGLSEHENTIAGQRLQILTNSMEASKMSSANVNIFGDHEHNQHWVYVDIQFDHQGEPVVFINDFFNTTSDDGNDVFRNTIINNISAAFPDAKFAVLNVQIQADGYSCSNFAADCAGALNNLDGFQQEIMDNIRKQDIKPANNDQPNVYLIDENILEKTLPKKMSKLFRPMQIIRYFQRLPEVILSTVHKGKTISQIHEEHTKLTEVFDEETGDFIEKKGGGFIAGHRNPKIVQRTSNFMKDNKLDPQLFDSVKDKVMGNDYIEELPAKRIVDEMRDEIREKPAIDHSADSVSKMIDGQPKMISRDDAEKFEICQQAAAGIIKYDDAQQIENVKTTSLTN